MKSLLSFFLALLFLLAGPWVFLASGEAGQICSPNLNLMPVPAQLSLQDGKFRLTGNLKMAVTGDPDGRLYPATTRALRRIDAQTG